MYDISDILVEWYRMYGRDLPWRQTRNPYLIWISETILQQTRVVQGKEYYLRFVARFPDVETLAHAGEDEVLKYWQGLGYYSRARHLLAAAREIVDRFDGKFPVDHTDIRSLPGIGEYTAAAIASFAYGLPIAVVDGNVYRVISRLFDLDLPIDSTKGHKTIVSLAQSLLDPTKPALHNQAIMDFGAFRCTPSAPTCESCPLEGKCLAHAAGNVAERPVKKGRINIRTRYFNYLHIVADGNTLLYRRQGKDIWQGLYEFPLIETSTPVETDEIRLHPYLTKIMTQMDNFRISRRIVMPRHQLSHQLIHAVFYRIETNSLPDIPGCIRLREEQISDYAVSRLTELYLGKRY